MPTLLTEIEQAIPYEMMEAADDDFWLTNPDQMLEAWVNAARRIRTRASKVGLPKRPQSPGKVREFRTEINRSSF